LANIDSPADEKNLIAYAINNVGDKYEGVVDMIRHRDPPPTFAQSNRCSSSKKASGPQDHSTDCP
nr:hybrid signal transduction histidine kinase M [Tanacetum cinerariifolium]